MSDHEDQTDIPVTPNILDPDLLPQDDENIAPPPTMRPKAKTGKRPTAADDDKKPPRKSFWQSVSDNKITIIVVFVIVIVLVIVAYFAVKYWSKEPEEGTGPPKPPSPQQHAAGGAEHAAASTAKPPPAAPTAKLPAKPAEQMRAAPAAPPQRPVNNVTHEALVKNLSPEHIQKMLMKARGATSEKEDAKMSSVSERASTVAPAVKPPAVEELTDEKSGDNDDDLGKQDEDDDDQTNDDVVNRETTAAAPAPAPEKPAQAPTEANGALWVIDNKGPKPPPNPAQREGLCTAVTREGSFCKNPATHGDRCGTHKKR